MNVSIKCDEIADSNLAEGEIGGCGRSIVFRTMHRGTITQFQTLKSRRTVHDEHFDAKMEGIG